jgi:hypothetical protein
MVQFIISSQPEPRSLRGGMRLYSKSLAVVRFGIRTMKPVSYRLDGSVCIGAVIGDQGAQPNPATR